MNVQRTDFDLADETTSTIEFLFSNATVIRAPIRNTRPLDEALEAVLQQAAAVWPGRALGVGVAVCKSGYAIACVHNAEAVSAQPMLSGGPG